MLPNGSEVLLTFARVSKVECRLVTLAKQSFVSRTGVTHGVCRRASVAMADADEKMSSPASAEAAEMSPEHVAEEVVRGSGDSTQGVTASGDVLDRQTEKTARLNGGLTLGFAWSCGKGRLVEVVLQRNLYTEILQQAMNRILAYLDGLFNMSPMHPHVA